MQNLIDGVIRELEQKNYFEAIKYCNQLIAQFPKNYIFYEIRGNCYLETGSFVTAIQNYTDALDLLPPNDSKSRITIASIYNRRGYARLKLNLYNESILDFQKAVEFKHDFAEAYNNCGNAYRKLEKYDDALIQCSRAIEYKEDFAEAYNNRGNIYYLFSKAAEAIKDYTKAIELNPNYTGAYYNRGVTYFYLLNKISEAKEDWEKVLKLNPSYEGELKEKIDKIKSTLELSEGKPASEAMSLVSDEEQEEENEEPVEKETIEEKQEEPMMEIYSDKVEEKAEEPEIKTSEPQEKNEESIDEIKSEEKAEEPIEEIKQEKKEEEHIEEIKSEETKEEPIEEVKQNVKKTDDIEIPEIDFKSLFKEDEKDADFEEEIKPLTEIFELIYEPKVEKDIIIPEEVRQLHNEISEIPKEPQKEEPILEEPAKEEAEKGEVEEEKETALPNEPKQRIRINETPLTYKPYYQEEDEKRSVFKSPIFVIPLVFIILILLSAGAYYVYNRVYNKKIQSNKQQVTEEKKDTVKASGNIDSTQIKDTLTVQVPNTGTKQEQKQTEKKEEKTTITEVTTIKNFVVIKDKDGIYLQVASLKEKSSADNKAAALNKKGLTTKVVEADLGFKGVYYRVRVGPFKNTDEAKTAADKID